MKIALVGYGKMGKEIESVALERGHEIVLKIGRSNIADMTMDHLKKADVAIEFTAPESAFDNVKACLEAGLPVVCGSTGWTARLDEAGAICNKHQAALLWASNFSIGVNIFFELNRKLALLMNHIAGYDIRLEEIHHTEKKDAPSGTAITLAEDALQLLDHKQKWVKGEASAAYEMGIVSYRKEKVPGTHIVQYRSGVDDIEIRHTAHSRKGFALGAVLAAEFLKDKQGIFSMKDVLDI